MGNRKKHSAENLKSQKKSVFSATLRNAPISPKKAVLVADAIRGLEVGRALAVLSHLNKAIAAAYFNLLKSAVSNYRNKTGDAGEVLYVSKAHVCQGMTLKRIQPAPQGRAHRIIKRYAHIRLEVGQKAIVEKSNVKPQSEIV